MFNSISIKDEYSKILHLSWISLLNGCIRAYKILFLKNVWKYLRGSNKMLSYGVSLVSVYIRHTRKHSLFNLFEMTIKWLHFNIFDYSKKQFGVLEIISMKRARGHLVSQIAFSTYFVFLLTFISNYFSTPRSPPSWCPNFQNSFSLPLVFERTLI